MKLESSNWILLTLIKTSLYYDISFIKNFEKKRGNVMIIFYIIYGG